MELINKMRNFAEELSQCWDRAVAKETSIAYHNALGFVSAHNTSKSSFFIRQMQHSYVSGRFSLRVPIPFAKRNLPCKGATITLVTDGKRWSVGCSVGEEWASLSRGWKDFVQDNGLKFGDACVFEVANYKKNKPVWNVIIFRKSDDDIDSVEVDRTSAAYQRAKAFKSDNINQDHPCFIRLMQPSYVSSTSVLVIPPSIIRENFAEKVNNIKLRVCDGAMWRVTCSLQALNARIGVGWSSFVKDHNLKVGDACLFEVNKINKFHVPLFFARRNLARKGANSVSMVMNGKKWLVRCLVSNRRADLTSGWRGFVQDNGLKVGDACIFEVASKSNKLVWNVLIFRN
ncbi:B3 domain-containing protein os03g0620400 [Phtheirospermum japonicum]|uniref:B3 domain-containing protein os03g0620400 n=1 Tax=Phtheirospermum japonicum TaxID=374723 RepID=A0A830BA99_9LAMI|nr:B3 domain-containing protein os03g0620400 [Phtheirospermum japonicum]